MGGQRNRPGRDAISGTRAAGHALYWFGQTYALLLISQFWTLANLIFDPRQAKRLFGFIGAGSSLGGFVRRHKARAREILVGYGEPVIFGPILPVVPYGRLDDAIAYVNAWPRPLALYYFDENRGRQDAVLAQTMSGGVTVNDCIYHLGQLDLPFGGVGPSGMGQYHGFDGFATFSKKRGVMVQRRWAGTTLVRPRGAAATG